MTNYYVIITSVLLLFLNFYHPYSLLLLIPLLISVTNLKLPRVIAPISLLLSLPFHDIIITALALQLVILTGD
ncbi:hypothetical protein [Stygiolobus azoricus]|uniref:Uncharacterized protein n=1 Tax=Stygiolobus azoricus TaxID=41675 RepID=A0A650CQE9_9CREN|nr:hypothetical protein [Stygiolobus azoricus]QGR19882.1 hypothetical protein D1868_07755 [Stygiolobus azoricus]